MSKKQTEKDVGRLYRYKPEGCVNGCKKCKLRVTGENDKSYKFKSCLECGIYYFLKSECGLDPNVNFVYNKKIEGCPFNKKYGYQTDFYFKKQNLCVEVKGDLTYFEVNKQRWLHEYKKDYNFYLLVLTNEDWIERCPLDGGENKAYIERAIEVQLNELKDFVNGKLQVEGLAEKSWQRLMQYQQTRERDLSEWNKRLQNNSKTRNEEAVK